MSTLIAGGIAIVLAVLGVMWRLLAVAKKSGIDEQKTKEAQARETDLEKIKRAADAGAHVDAGKLSDDPYDRDRRSKP